MILSCGPDAGFFSANRFLWLEFSIANKFTLHDHDKTRKL